MSQEKNQPIELLLVSNFNLANLAAILNKDKEVPPLTASCAPFGQVMQVLLEQSTEVWGSAINGAVVWTSPENISSSFRGLLEGRDGDGESMLREVQQFCQAVLSIPGRIKSIFVPSWALGPMEGRLGLLDMDRKRGISRALLRMNLALAEGLESDPRVFVLDSNRWLMFHGRNSLSERLWYMSKTPYSSDMLKVVALEIRAALSALLGRARKLIVLDLDDTLWGGIVGDVGWQNLRLGGHDPVGEAYKDFQLSLRTLKQRGILLAIASKNEETTAMEAIQSHPEMVLRKDDFVGWRINWRDKAQNIADLASELNLGLQSVVFLDDNPAERARVRESLPEVLVPEWPDSPLYFKGALQSLRCFDQSHFTVEDQQRSEMYTAERKRRESGAQVGSLDTWLGTLEVKVRASPLDKENLDRAVQLLNKTNQMNLRTRRLTKEELWEWSQKTGNRFITFRVSDKYGDYGLVGLASFCNSSGPDQVAQVVDYVLSCRVMGRRVEETMLHVLARGAQGAGALSLRVPYEATSKNQPCLRFFQGSGLSSEEGGATFTMGLKNHYAQPISIQLELAPGMEVVLGESR